MFAFLLLISCKNDSHQSATGTSNTTMPENGIRYAKRFTIRYAKEQTILYLFGNKANFDTTATYIISKNTSKPISVSKNVYFIKSPCKKIAALSSIYASVFYELGLLENLVAIDNIDYVCNPAIIQKHKRQQLKELAKMPQLDLEQTVVLNPDILFTFGMGEGEKDKDKKLAQTNIPIAISVDHLEESPLARAEWIKFFAAFVNKKEKADSIFAAVEKNYLALKEQAEKTGNRPSVFSEIKYSDSWYVPGGKSYVAKLLKDAGANYLWKEDFHFGSLPLSFEQVYAAAKDADYWINLSTVKSKQELLSYETRYTEFKAFTKGNLYNNNKHTNALGYSTYWETGMIYPNKILNDLILIFHPELKSQQLYELFYYRKLN
jgi:iron complex transport system substrate-binding protein